MVNIYIMSSHIIVITICDITQSLKSLIAMADGAFVQRRELRLGK